MSIYTLRTFVSASSFTTLDTVELTDPDSNVDLPMVLYDKYDVICGRYKASNPIIHRVCFFHDGLILSVSGC